VRVLVTNDDGVASVGLHVLAAAMLEHGFDVVVAAPNQDMSGAGAAIGRLHVDEHIDAELVELPGLDGVPAYAISGPPALCVLAGRLGGFGEVPELVVSGINPGPNTGRATLHSGTVGAALTAANFGCSGLAVSLNVGDEMLWDTAAQLARSAVDWLIDAPAKTVLNLNVPNLRLEDVRGVRWASLAPFGTVRAAIIEAADAGGRLQMELRPTGVELPPDCDTALVLDGYAAITSIVGIRATEPVDVAEHMDAQLRTRAPQ
jgi:5'-nucleotidase